MPQAATQPDDFLWTWHFPSLVFLSAPQDSATILDYPKLSIQQNVKNDAACLFYFYIS